MSGHRLTVQRHVDLAPHGERVLFLSRAQPAHQPDQRLFTEKDLSLLLLQGIMTPAILALPRRSWPTLCAVTSALRTARKKRRQLGDFAAKVAAVLENPREHESPALFAAIQRGLHERYMIYLAERMNRGATTDLIGAEHLQESLARGRGVLLWNTPSLADTIITKRALASAGFRAWQLSVHSHGFSQSRFATKHLNPPQIAVENRHLAGRIWFKGPGAVAATREVMRHLKAGRAVLCTNSLHAGSAFVAAPFAGAYHLVLPTTPLSIAARAKVPLHLVTTVQTRPFAHHVCHVSADLLNREPTAAQSDPDTRIAHLARGANKILYALLRNHPDQIRLWDRLMQPRDFNRAPLPCQRDSRPLIP